MSFIASFKSPPGTLNAAMLGVVVFGFAALMFLHAATTRKPNGKN